MKRLAIVALLVALLVTVAGDRATAQSVPTAPTGVSATAAPTVLTVMWTAPTGSTDITAYDVGYIRADAPDKTPASWTVVDNASPSDTLQYAISGLRDETGYEIQVRAVNSNGDGAWSASHTATTTDHANMGHSADATPLALGTSVLGYLSTSDDLDYFRLTVDTTGELWVYTTGETDTHGTFTDHDRYIIETADNAGHPHNLLNFSLRRQVRQGDAHFIVINRKKGATGPYRLHARIESDPGNTLATAKPVTVGVPSAGRITTAGGIDFFTFTLNETTEVAIMARGTLTLSAALLRADETVVARDDNGFPESEGFLIRQELEAGTYYVRIFTAWPESGPYELFIEEASDPGSTSSTATALALYATRLGRISSATDQDYYRFTLDAETHVTIQAHPFGTPFALEAKLFDAQNATVDAFTISRADYERKEERNAVGIVETLAAGTYVLRMSAPSGESGGRYLLYFVEDLELIKVLRECTALTSPQSDPLYGCQWHLNNTGQVGGTRQDINVEGVWADGNMGAGVKIAIVDDAIDADHEDLSANVLTARNHDYYGIGFDGRAEHGTQVAGLIAARDNALGVRGVAPRASIYSYNLLADPTGIPRNEADAMTRNMADTAVSNNSWSFPDTGELHSASPAWEAAIEQGVTQGFGGKGVVYVFPGGNGHGGGDYANLDGRSNFYAVTAVCAVDSRDKRPSYSEKGPNLWVCAPGLPAIATTSNGDRYTRSFGGTSGATAIVSGVAALIRAENANLTWRDVKLILAASARKNDSGSLSWGQAGVKYGSTSTSDRYNYSIDYGFGVVDAGAAVTLAEAWTTNVPAALRTVEAESETLNAVIVDADLRERPQGSVTSTVTLPGGFVEFIEFIEVTISLDHSAARDLRIELRSPSNAVSILSVPLTVTQASSNPFAESVELKGAFRLGSARHLGEEAGGDWTLFVQDQLNSHSGKLTSWSIKAYGHGLTAGYPESPTATSGMRMLTVGWTAPTDTGGSDITSYDLRYIRSSAEDKADANWTERASIGTDDTATYDLTGLGLGVEYDLQVRAVNGAGAGPWSASLVVRSSLEKPFAPSLTRVTPRDVGLGAEWDAPTEDGGSEITSYDLRTIRSDATEAEKLVDSNWAETLSAWTAGDLRGNATGLTNGVEYDVQVRAENAIGESDWSATLKGTPAIQNTDAAFADDTTDREVAENLRVGGNVGARVSATDPDGDALTYSILGDHELFEIDAMNGQLRTKAALDFDTPPTSYTFTVAVSDMLNSSDDADPTIDDSIVVTIDLTDVNEPPVIEGDDTFTVAENHSGTLDTYTASDPESDTTTITWALGGVDAGDFTITAGVLSFKSPPDYDIPADSGTNNIYNVTVQASDGTKTGTYEVTVTVTPVDERPVIEGPRSVMDFPENSPATRVVGSRYSATDPEGAGVTWSDLSGNDAADFDLSNSGVLTFKRSPNFEMKDEYSVTLNAYDGRLPGSLDVTVTIANVNEPPVVRRRSGMGAFSIEENSRTTVGSFDADDPENDDVTWSLETTGNHGRFEIDATSGVLSFKDPPDYESSDLGSGLVRAYTVTVRATEADDGDPQTRELPGSLPVTVAVTDVNEAPTITGDAAPSVAENTTAVATYSATDPEKVPPSWSLQGGAGVFMISSAGALSFASAPNYEVKSSYTVTVHASDGTNDDDHDVTVTVTDVDEVEELTLSDPRPLIDEDYTAAFKDGTGDVVQSPTWQWSRSTRRNSGHVAIIGATAATYVPVTADSGYYLRVTASYNDGHGQVRKTLQATSDLATAATSTSNEAPAFPDPLFTGGATGLSVRENATAGTLVGTAPQATDPESKPLRYSLAVTGFTTAPPFEINVTSRQIRVTGDAELNHEGPDATYRVTVTVKDDFNVTDTATFDITIEDVNERPVAVDDPSVTTLEDMPVTFDVLGNDTDPDDDDTLTVRSTSRPRRGRVLVDSSTQMVTYTPAENDHGTYTFTYTAMDASLTSATSALVTVAVRSVNDAPEFATETTTRTVSEGAQPGDDVGTAVTARDVDHPDLTYSLSGASDFVIDDTGQISVAPRVTLDRERTASYTATVTAIDALSESDSITVTINVSDVPEPPTAGNDTATTFEDTEVIIRVLDNDTDPDTERARLRVSVLARPLNGAARVESDRTITYTPNKDYNGDDSFTYRLSDGTLTDDGSVTVTVTPVNDAPTFPSPTAARSVPEDAEAGDNVGAPVTATDVDNAMLTYSLVPGADSSSFNIDADSGQITVATVATFHIATKETYEVTVTADDGSTGTNATATITVTITVGGGPVRPPVIITGGGGGGGGGGGPSPSTVDFEWTVKRDIEALDGGNDWSTGLWSDGRTLFIAENGQGADDEVYAYDLASGERLAEREFELAETNRAPRGFWSDGDTVWVSDSGRDRLFAYALASGERQEQRELELADRNADARGLWSDGESVWVLDSGKNALFAYGLGSGELLAEYALDRSNGDPRGIWSDGLSVWVSDHGAKRLFAYRLPAAPDDDAEDAAGEEEAPAALERIKEEEFSELSGASNNSPRGIWSDGDVMYVADESDDRVYTYNMPDAIDARLASLSLSGIDIGEFDRGRTEYEGVPGEGVTETTIKATAVQRRTAVVIEPPDADGNSDNGYQVDLEGLAAITVSVTSADGSRTRVYRVQLEAPASILELSPTWTSIVWPGDDGAAITDALRGDGEEADITDRVIVVYQWDEATGAWLAFFPTLADVPGINTLSAFAAGHTYWFAVSEPLTWTVSP